MRPTILALVLTLSPVTAWAGPPAETPPGLRENVRLHQVPERLELPALDVAKLRAEDEKRRNRGEPPRYAIPKDIAPVTPKTHGAWETLADGGQVWRYRIRAEGATSVEPGFTRFHLPEGAALYVHGLDGKRVRGPYTHADNESHGQLWVPIVEGARATVELELEPGVSSDAVELEMTQVLQGYDEFWKTDPLTKTTNSCNVDVICPQAEDWEDPIASVALITVGGNACTGQMVNDTAFSGRPLFLTANHCQLRESNAASLKVYWNYRNPTCRNITSSPGQAPEGDGSLDDVQTGSFFRARFVSSDFTLVELDEMPDPEWNVFWTGWDRRDTTFSFATGIHHPQGEEKRISFENDPLDIIDGDQLNAGGPNLLAPSDVLERSHLRINDWDLGVTEQGSSGSGLWNPARRLVGQLHGGGTHQCDNNDFDWYGRFHTSWEGGGTPETSLKPWLDPLGTGEAMLDGRDGDCNAPNVSIADNAQGPTAGETFTLSAGGGSNSNVEFFWDVDGDGIVDTSGRNAQVKFGSPGERRVELIARNKAAQCGTTVTKTMTVKGPDLRVANVGAPRQLEGDGDNVIEPGERWDVPVTLANQGSARATNPRAIFTRSGLGDAEPTGPDGFGYTAAGSLSSGNCRYQWVNIAGQNNRVTFTSASDFPSSDDGGSDPIAVDDFQFYNPGVSSMVMSTNGYLTVSAARNGGDFSNDCPLPAVPDRDPASGSTGLARLAAYHDDLVTGLGWYLRQVPCERPGDTDAGNGACHIFQWNNVEVLDPATYGSGNVQAFNIPAFEFQAILYEGSGEIVYQYGPNAPREKATPTVGIQNNMASDGLTWGCSAGGAERAPLRPAPSSAVCFFHPKAAQIEFDPSGISLVTPALEFDNIPVNNPKTARVVFDIDDSADCGSDIGISLHGVVSDQAFSTGPGTIFSARIGGDDRVCDASVQSAAAKAHIDFQPGMYYNPARDGHGADIHIGAGGSQAFLVWYTYGPGRQPVWYLAVGEYEDDQIVADLLKFTDGNVEDPQTVGKVIVTFIDETHAFFSWTLNGEKGGEPFQVLTGAPPPLDPNRTGHWFPPSQDGWGMTFNQQGQTEFDIVYFYDANGQPVWALGVKEAAAGKTVSLDQFKGVCPGCDWAPATFQSTGSLTREFSGPRKGSVRTDISLKAPLNGNWKRGPVDIEILSDPVQ